MPAQSHALKPISIFAIATATSVLLGFIATVADAQSPSAPTPISNVEIEAIRAFLTTKSEIADEAIRKRKLLSANSVKPLSAVVQPARLTTLEGIDAMSIELNKAYLVELEAGKIAVSQWATVKDSLNTAKLEPRLNARLKRAFEISHRRFSQGHKDWIAAADKIKGSSSDMLVFARKHVGSVKLVNGMPAYANKDVESQFYLLLQRGEDAMTEQIRITSKLFAEDGLFSILKCAQSGHSDSTNPDIGLCSLRDRVASLDKRTAFFLQREPSRGPGISEMVESVTKKRMISRREVELAKRFSYETEFDLIEKQRLLAEGFTDMEIAFTDTEVNAAGKKDVAAGLSLLKQLQLANDAIAQANDDSIKTLRVLLDFFLKAESSIKVANNALQFSNKEQEGDYKSLVSLLEASQAKSKLSSAKLKDLQNQFRSLCRIS